MFSVTNCWPSLRAHVGDAARAERQHEFHRLRRIIRLREGGPARQREGRARQ
jgi:hypothetical protein